MRTGFLRNADCGLRTEHADCGPSWSALDPRRYHKTTASLQQVAMGRKTRGLSVTVLANEADDDISKLAFKNN